MMQSPDEITPYQPSVDLSLSSQSLPLSPLTTSPVSVSGSASGAVPKPCERLLLVVKGDVGQSKSLLFKAGDPAARPDLQISVVVPAAGDWSQKFVETVTHARHHFGAPDGWPVVLFVADYWALDVACWQCLENHKAVCTRLVAVVGGSRQTENMLLSKILSLSGSEVQAAIARTTRHYRRLAADHANALKRSAEPAPQKPSGGGPGQRPRARPAPVANRQPQPQAVPKKRAVVLVESSSSSPSPTRGKRQRSASDSELGKEIATQPNDHHSHTPPPKKRQQVYEAVLQLHRPTTAAFDYPCFGLWQELHELRRQVGPEAVRIAITDRASSEILKGLDSMGLGRDEYRELVNSVKLASNFVCTTVVDGACHGSLEARPPYGAINVNLLALINKRMQGAARAMGF